VSINILGVASVNLFNFIDELLPDARLSLVENKINIANWEKNIT